MLERPRRPGLRRAFLWLVLGSARYGAARASDAASGINGVLIYKAPNVAVENLNVCNFLGGAADAGNGVWWNGGADSGQVGGHGFTGSYLTATSTFYQDETSAAQYGIFSSNWNGGTWDQMYASNFNDSGFYIGACQQVCNQTVNHVWSAVQRARLLRDQLRRFPADRELPVRSQRGRL